MIREYIRADYARFEKKNRKIYFWVRFVHYPAFRLLVIFRIIQGLRCSVLKRILRVYYRHLERKYLIDLPLTVKLGKGCFFPHNGPVVFNPAAIVGENCSIHPCTLIGTVRGEGGGIPIVGHNVFIGPGAKLLGNIVVGDYCFICPGSVLLNSVKKGCTVGGTPARVLNENGMENYKLYL